MRFFAGGEVTTPSLPVHDFGTDSEDVDDPSVFSLECIAPSCTQHAGWSGNSTKIMRDKRIGEF